MSNSITLAGIGNIHTDAEGRYSLNDFHKAAGALPHQKPSEWLSNKQTQELAEEIGKAGIPAFTSVRGGRNPGTYVCKELVYAYAMWISAPFQLKVIRAFDALVTGDIEKAQQIARPATKSSERIKFNMALALNRAAMDDLNMAPSGRLLQFKRIEQAFDLPATLPNYAEDNNGSANGSMEFASLTELLHEHQAGMSAKAANSVLLGMGFMKEATRPSSKTPNKIAKFKVIDGIGLKYGKNMSSPSNPRETQPMWYRETFGDLLDVIANNAKSAA
jgi:hypothetical protein